jgi:hypothetical protein
MASPRVISAAQGLPAKDRWPDGTADALTAARGQANPGDVVARKTVRITL